MSEPLLTRFMVRAGGEVVKAFAIDEFGGAGSVRDLPAPDAAEGEVRVRVAAAGVNPADKAVVQGSMKDFAEHRFPLIPGIDASGVVDAVGEGVEAWSVGDEVFGAVGKMSFGAGTFAEFAAMSAASIARKPSSLDHAAAAAMPTAGVTALTMLDALALDRGQTVLVVGATGGVGGYFVQLAARRGAHVLAVCRGENADYARSLGAEDVIDYTAGDVAEAVQSRSPDGIDAIVDLHGDKDGLARLGELVRTGGGVASAVGAADEQTLADRGVKAANVVTIVTTKSLEELARLREAGELVDPPRVSFELARAQDALSAVASGHTRGKVVLIVG